MCTNRKTSLILILSPFDGRAFLLVNRHSPYPPSFSTIFDGTHQAAPMALSYISDANYSTGSQLLLDSGRLRWVRTRFSVLRQLPSKPFLGCNPKSTILTLIIVRTPKFLFF
ncbi:unnamed protein product [Linum tenue]|uniref:Uncharacterized protein n=1 Tax=Linum tenue TaxID=586396 RepID=A0AAV0RTU7_9ROSI|nr:unnamed protein product [Linum tenue]